MSSRTRVNSDGTVSTLTLATPSRGVQQWRDDISGRTTRIAWTSSGGRGLPCTVIILPVKWMKDTTRWAPPEKLMKDLKEDPKAFWFQHYQLRHSIRDPSVGVGRDDDRSDPAAPRVMTVANDGGELRTADHVLVLLIYDEPRGVGETDALVADQDPATYRVEVELIEDFFTEGYTPRLVTRGLVRLSSSESRDSENDVVFALASCQYPAGLTDGAPNDHREPPAPSSASLLRLSEKLTQATSSSPSLLLLAGDQVYVDATAGLFDPRPQSDRLRLPYQDLFYSPGAQSVFGLIPVAMILDDHEIVDNWEPGIELPRESPLAKHVQAYRRFQRIAGPPLHDPGSPDVLWCEFTHFGVPFFLADTRTERHTPDGSPRRADNWREARIMCCRQWDALREFLLAHRHEVSFVVSSSMFLPRGLGLKHDPSLALASDTWDGFPASRDELLAFLYEHDLSRVVFLSGDAHTSCVAKATVARDRRHEVKLWSVHSSGLYCPYPFANGSEDNYARDEEFGFVQPAATPGGPALKYRCVVETHWKSGDGFATLALTSSRRGPQVLDVCFNRAGVKDPELLQISFDEAGRP